VCFAAAEGFVGLSVVVDVLDCAVPADHFSVFASAGGGTGSHPPPADVAVKDAALDVEKVAGSNRFVPRMDGLFEVVGMQDTEPAVAEHLLFGKSGESFAALTDVEDAAVGIGGPGNLRIEFDGMTVVIFAFGEGFLGGLASGDIDDGDRDADDLVDFVASGLIGHEKGTYGSWTSWIGVPDFETGVRFTVESAEEIGFALGEFLGDDLGDVAAEVGGDRKTVHLGKTFVDADEAEIAIEKAEADGNSVVDGVELGEALGREPFEAERQAGFGEDGLVFGGGGWKWRVEALGEDFGKLRGWNGTAVEPSLADIAAEPEEHVGDGLGFDSFGDGGETEAVAETYDGGSDLSAFTVVSDGAYETGVDF
jgi:hypothetical protein